MRAHGVAFVFDADDHGFDLANMIDHFRGLNDLHFGRITRRPLAAGQAKG